MASIFGASKGIAPCCFACSIKSFPSTTGNSACGSTTRLISQGQATRSTFISLRVIHFIGTSYRLLFGPAGEKERNSPSHSQNNSGYASCEDHRRLRHFLYPHQNPQRYEPNQHRGHIDERTPRKDIGRSSNRADGSRGDSLDEGLYLSVLGEPAIIRRAKKNDQIRRRKHGQSGGSCAERACDQVADKSCGDHHGSRCDHGNCNCIHELPLSKPMELSRDSSVKEGYHPQSPAENQSPRLLEKKGEYAQRSQRCQSMNARQQRPKSPKRRHRWGFPG